MFFRGLNMSIISSIFLLVSGSTYFFPDRYRVSFLLAVVYGILDEVFGLSRKEAIKKIAKKIWYI